MTSVKIETNSNDLDDCQLTVVIDKGNRLHRMTIWEMIDEIYLTRDGVRPRKVALEYKGTVSKINPPPR